MTPVFRFAHAAGADWQTAANTCLAELTGPPASLGFLYVTDLLGDHIAEILEKQTGVNPLWVPPWSALDRPDCGNGPDAKLLAGITNPA